MKHPRARKTGKGDEPNDSTSESGVGTPPLADARDAAIVGGDLLLSVVAAKDLESFISAAFSLLRTTVICDFASAFYRRGENGLLKGHDSLGRHYGPGFMRRYVELDPAVPLAAANRGIRILTTRDALPKAGDAVRRMAFYREVMQPLGWRHSVALCFWGNPAEEFPLCVLSVDRSERQPDFSRRDVSRLERLHPFMDCTVTRLYERQSAETVHDGMAVILSDEARGVAVLDRNLRLVRANRVARQLCAVWIGGGDQSSQEASSLDWRLPSALAKECRELHHEWHELLRVEPDATGLRRRRRVVHTCVPDLTASITMVCPSTTDFAQPTFLLELEQRDRRLSSDGPNPALPLLQMLTRGQRAVAMVLADGLSNGEIADQLGKSVSAVKFLLHKIYEKTGVPNRAALVAALRSSPKGAKYTP